ncbi:isochorismate synthase [Corynebacterium macclintockiae]|uniref:isochorismate synthase n=1 Tax=Corynebacterium macclintockiae TaxID=2913501 RepID=A0A9X3RPE9_9CORY|nr:isochorismate synthase [Corynebacterium macclintockiae]MCZ9303979.1 isochorismate synthase [Corynebacterium macclintockiae]
MTHEQRPATAPDFLLSRPDRSIRTQGRKATFPDPFEASTALRNKDADLIVGAFPFDTSLRAALMEPQNVIRAEGPLEPPAFFRGQDAARSLVVESVEAQTTMEEHAAMVAAAVATIQQTQLEKVVLARAVDITFAEAVDPLLIAARLIDLSAYRDGFAVDLSATGRDEYRNAMFVGSSPEMLIRREGRRVSAFPMAGSAPRTGVFSIDDATARDLASSTKDLREHRFVVDHYRRVLEPLCEKLDIPDTPEIHETNEMIHLGTQIAGTLKDDEYSALDLALMLHPTPAIGGTPTDDALGVISQEKSPREFYSGAVGWCDSEGDGEFMVSIRCAIVEENTARAWAGGGVVVDSNPTKEAEETSAKLQTALRALNVPAALREV